MFHLDLAVSRSALVMIDSRPLALDQALKALFCTELKKEVVDEASESLHALVKAARGRQQ